MLDPDDLDDLTVIVALAGYLAGPETPDAAKGILADELVAMIHRGLMTIDARNAIIDGEADTYLSITIPGDVCRLSVVLLDLPDDITFEWPSG